MSHRTQRILVYVLVVVAVGALWWLISATGSVKRLLLPTPTDVWHALRTLLDQPSAVFSAVWETLRLLLIAFAISAPCGLLLGVVVGRSRLLTDAYEPLLANLNTIPVIVLYPLLAGLLGLGGLPQVVLGAIVCFFPIAISSMWAARDVDATLLLAARAMGARGPRL
ncbi:MAG: ABC transporter permease subunit, partial [Solirubrobacteraceae bacterium]